MLTDSFVFLRRSPLLYSVRNCIYTVSVARSNVTTSPRRSPLLISVCLNLTTLPSTPQRCFLSRSAGQPRIQPKSLVFLFSPRLTSPPSTLGLRPSLNLAWLFLTWISFVLFPPSTSLQIYLDNHALEILSHFSTPGFFTEVLSRYQ
jgi:hypothetical protein